MYGETTFGHWLRQRRRQFDLTQADLARQVNCSEITIRKIEADERTPSRQIAELLADCLEVPPAERPAFIAFARGRTGAGALGPPLAAPSSLPGGLPAPLTRLLGRDQDVARICRCLLDDTCLLTLIGPPGIGKTHLSLSIASALRDQFPDGAVFVALAAVADPGRVVNALAQAVGVTESAGQSLIDRLTEALCDRSMLLVLDNFEHVLPAAADIAQLLAACPELKVLATSRAALHIRGEQLFPVSPLALPTMAWPLDAQAVARSSAVMLFVERAQAAASYFALSDENAATVAAICARLDGLPLAIELVAARMRLLSPLALLSRLGQRLDLLAAGPSATPPRHQTLRRAIEWSYNLLSPAEQRLFERLGVLVGDYELEAIEAICGGSRLETRDWRFPQSSQFPISNLQSPILEALEVLIDHSLVARRAGADDEPRCMMLETIREYALERLAASKELPALRERHARYYLALAERAEPELNGAQQERWLNRLEREHDQFHAALSWAHEAGAAEIGMRLAAALWRFWYTRCHLSEGRRWLMAALAADRAGASAARPCVLLGAGVLAREQGDLVEARRLLEASLEAARQHGEQPCMATVLYTLGVADFDRGQVARAIVYLEECLRLQRLLRDKTGIASALNGLGNVLLGRDDARAEALLEESVELQRDLQNVRGVAFALHSLGIAALRQRGLVRAYDRFREALRLFQDLGDKIGIADCLAGLAAVAGGRLEPERAARLWRAAERLRESIGASLPAADRKVYESCLACLRPRPGPPVYEELPLDLPELLVGDLVSDTHR